MFTVVDDLMWVASDIFTVTMGRIFSTLSESAEIIVIVLFLFFLQFVLVWNRKIIVCSSVVTIVCVTTEYRTITHSYFRFDQKITF